MMKPMLDTGCRQTEKENCVEGSGSAGFGLLCAWCVLLFTLWVGEWQKN